MGKALPNSQQPADHDPVSPDEAGTPRVAFEVFYEDGRFGITVATEQEAFDTGCFQSFDAAQEALRKLVDDTIERQAKEGRRIGMRCIVLADAPV
jgi:hypothetical protein